MCVVKHTGSYIVYRYICICTEVQKCSSKIYINLRVEVVNRKNEKDLLFYLNILIKKKIKSEVDMTKI